MFKRALILAAIATLSNANASWADHHQPDPNHNPILEGRYWLGGTDEGLEVQGDRYRYYSEGGEREWQSTHQLQAIKEGVVFDGKVYWCLSTMKLKTGREGCSEQGWSVRGTSSTQTNPQIADFIPQGWRIEKEVSGDLNGDGQADRVVHIVKGGVKGRESWAQPRSLLVLKATASGWKKIATAPNLLLCSSCAGMMGGPDGQHIRLEIDNGILIVKQLAGSRHAIAMTHRFWIDRTSQDVVLIGEDLKSYDRVNGNEIIDSRNFLTGKRIVEDYRRQGNEKKKLIQTQTLNVSRDLVSIESVDIKAARLSAPALPSD